MLFYQIQQEFLASLLHQSNQIVGKLQLHWFFLQKGSVCQLNCNLGQNYITENKIISSLNRKTTGLNGQLHQSLQKTAS